MKNLLLIFTLTSMIFHQAAVAGPIMPISKDFKEKNQELLSRVRQSSLFILDGCKGTIISNEGHVLTAAHCLPSLLKKSIKLGKINFLQIQDQVTEKDMTLMVQFENNSEAPVKVVQAQFLYSGKGYFVSLDNPNSFPVTEEERALLMGLIKAGLGPAEDYAIFKLKDVDSKCLPMAQEVNHKERVFSISWHGFNHDDKWSWLESSVSGPLMRDPNESETYRHWMATRSSSKFADEVSEAAFGGKILFSQLDTKPGWSGSGLINLKGEIVGVNNYGFDFLEQEGQGIAVAASVKKIFQDALHEKGEIVHSWFDCKDTN